MNQSRTQNDEVSLGALNGSKAILEITKFRLVSLVLWSVAVGFYLASAGPLNLPLLFSTLSGTALIGAGAMCLNQYLERESDAKMKRTENRPLPSGRLRPGRALGLGIFLSAAGFSILAAAVNPLTGMLSLATLLAYLFVYTPLKTRTSLCILVGAVPGAMPPVLGWAAVRGEVTAGAWILFAILFLWQLPHVLAIGWVHRDDFARAGFRMLCVTDPRGEKSARRIFIYSLLLLPLGLVPFLAGMTGVLYVTGAFLLGVWFASSGFRMWRSLGERARPFFRHSIVYLSLLFLLMVLDKR